MINIIFTVLILILLALMVLFMGAGIYLEYTKKSEEPEKLIRFKGAWRINDFILLESNTIPSKDSILEVKRLLGWEWITEEELYG